jgi:uncharacterized protein YceK
MKNCLLLLILCVGLSACGSNYRASGAKGSIIGGTKVSVKATSNDADPGIRNAISSELARRGLQVVDNAPPNGLALSYYDEWKWDLAMYLWALDIQIAEAGTGKVLATGDFSHFGIHHYPNNRAVVREIFEKMDQEGVFRR